MTITNYQQIGQYKCRVSDAQSRALQNSKYGRAYDDATVPSTQRANISSRHRRFDEISRPNLGLC